eukprot:TRINITY_DN27046_c0_g1_i1.p1 TRINITY_DN27046_c0_g1~~TRINITY_DN27046_c0_g1_i1.p1  ORF type:complete len:478 (+),score=76.42 TRINITY_DN27046_c0_g1_i1:50-1435(+)
MAPILSQEDFEHLISAFKSLHFKINPWAEAQDENAIDLNAYDVDYKTVTNWMEEDQSTREDDNQLASTIQGSVQALPVDGKVPCSKLLKQLVKFMLAGNVCKNVTVNSTRNPRCAAIHAACLQSLQVSFEEQNVQTTCLFLENSDFKMSQIGWLLDHTTELIELVDATTDHTLAQAIHSWKLAHEGRRVEYYFVQDRSTTDDLSSLGLLGLDSVRTLFGPQDVELMQSILNIINSPLKHLGLNLPQQGHVLDVTPVVGPNTAITTTQPVHIRCPQVRELRVSGSLASSSRWAECDLICQVEHFSFLGQGDLEVDEQRTNLAQLLEKLQPRRINLSKRIVRHHRMLPLSFVKVFNVCPGPFFLTNDDYISIRQAWPQLAWISVDDLADAELSPLGRYLSVGMAQPALSHAKYFYSTSGTSGLEALLRLLCACLVAEIPLPEPVCAHLLQAFMLTCSTNIRSD